MKTTPSAQQNTIHPPMSWEELKFFIQSNAEQQKVTDQRFQELAQQQKETDQRFQELAQQQKETDRKFQELAQQQKETDRKLQELAQQHKETEQSLNESHLRLEKNLEASSKEFDRRMQERAREIDKQLRDITNRFLSQSGHIIEGLMEPAALNLFRNIGFDITGCWKEMKGSCKATGRKMEVDLFYHDTTEAIAVEVKILCTKEKVDHYIDQMSHFKEVFPKYSDVNVYAAIAALNFDRGADEYAKAKGLYVIRVSDNDIFTVDPVNKEDRIFF